jgi:hypothetical protein
MQNHIDAPQIPRRCISDIVFHKLKAWMRLKIIPKPLDIDPTDRVAMGKKCLG